LNLSKESNYKGGEKVAFAFLRTNIL